MTAWLFFVSPQYAVRGRPRPSVTHNYNTCARRIQIRACESAEAPPSQEEVERLFSRLTHVNKNMRKKASIAISEMATATEIERLLSLLEVEDVSHRRAAVQTLGMTGLQSVPRLIELLATSENSTVRASCAKALAAVALFYPQHREEFPGEALDGLRRALEVDQDPVTRLSVVGCLGTVGSDAKGDDGQSFSGSDRAVDILDDVCASASDMAVGATAVSALAQVAQNGSPDRKRYVLQKLQSICNMADSDDEDSALRYVKEIAAGHIDQLNDQTSSKKPTNE